MSKVQSSHDARIDAYIAKSADFAQPVLRYLRATVHAACPDVEEAIKWGMPHFMYHGMLCGMASFKAHCSFGFWKGAQIVKAADRKDREAMGQFGRLTGVRDLPPKKQLIGYIKSAMKLNEPGAIAPLRTKRPARKPLAMQKDLAAALKRDGAARATWLRFSPSQQRDYLEWLIDAKTDATRERRLATTMEWLGEGKSRNWKYMKK